MRMSADLSELALEKNNPVALAPCFTELIRWQDSLGDLSPVNRTSLLILNQYHPDKAGGLFAATDLGNCSVPV